MDRFIDINIAERINCDVDLKSSMDRFIGGIVS